MKVVMLRGLPGSGKSFWAQEKLKQEPGRWKIVSRDPLRALDGGQYSKENEPFIIVVENALIGLALASGFNVIIDDTNLHVGALESFRELTGGVEVVLQDFMDVSIEVCIGRDSQRLRPVGEQRIREMHARYLKERGIE